MDKKIIESEQNYKKDLFNKINDIKIKEIHQINEINYIHKGLKIKTINIPSCAITLNNKLVELYHIFNKCDLLIIYDENKTEELTPSLLGDAIIHDLFGQLVESITILKKHVEILKKILNQKKKKSFLPFIKKPIDLSLTQKEKEILEQILKKHSEIDNQIWKYTLEDNIVRAVTKEMMYYHRINGYNYDNKTNNVVIPENIINGFKKLGFENLLCELQKNLNEEYDNFRKYAIEQYKKHEEMMNDFNKRKKR